MLDSLPRDAVFGWRQILKHKAVSAAAILSLALGIGASLAAFRLIDALFLRPLPIPHPDRLYEITYPSLFEGRISTIDAFNYAAYVGLRSAIRDKLELLAISRPWRVDTTFGSAQEIERAWVQYVSGSMFAEFEMKPALGRLLDARDDGAPGAHPYAVISYAYWSRRFAKDPGVLGRRLRVGTDELQIIGVAPEGFTGTDPGMFTDLFMPNAMNPYVLKNTYWSVYRAFFLLKPGSKLEEVRDRLSAALHANREEEVKTWPPQRLKSERYFYVAAPVSLEAAPSGRSTTQRSYQRAIAIFALLVGLVLLISCANVANLMTAQAGARSREMALRVSLGAGRAQLMRLVVIEGASIAAAASALGIVFSWWAGPFVVSALNGPNQPPVALDLPADWRVVLFAIALAFGVTMLFSLIPALRASSITPAASLKGEDPRKSPSRLMTALIGVQVAFCTFVLFIGGLFIATFQRMANQSTGFSAERVLAIESGGDSGSADIWYQETQRLRSIPGVESAALGQWTLMSGNARTVWIWANGQSPDGSWSNSTWFLGVSPHWFETMGMRLLDGRDFRWDDEYPKVAIVNEKFARHYFSGASAVGRSFESSNFQGNSHVAMRIVGVVNDARYEDMRLPVPMTAYVPFRALSDYTGIRATFVVRTKPADPTTLASTLRREIAAHPEMRVTNIVGQEELVNAQMIRERFLAMLALFFAAVASLLAAVGLCGVLNYAVLNRRREFGIRLALGAPSGDIAWRVTLGSFAVVALGSCVGLWLGALSQQYVVTLLYQVKPNEPRIMAIPIATLLAAAMLAAIPPVLRAMRIDPAALLRSE